MLSDCKKEKIKFVEELNNTLTKYIHNVESIKYEFYNNGNGYYEYLVINYKGGAKAVRNCTGNSLSSILNEIVRLIDGGYYDELDYYNSVKEKYTLETE